MGAPFPLAAFPATKKVTGPALVAGGSPIELESGAFFRANACAGRSVLDDDYVAYSISGRERCVAYSISGTERRGTAR